MFCFYLLLILCFSSGSFGVRKTESIYQLTTAQQSFENQSLNTQQNRQSSDILNKNVHDDNSGRVTGLRPSTPILQTKQATSYDDQKVTFKVYQPREDPKLFYQSKSYLEEMYNQNFNDEVASIYPGREVVRADEEYRIPKHLLSNNNENNYFNLLPSKTCVKCPKDKTLIAKKGVDRVFLQHPILKTCSGRKAPKMFHFLHMYGPKFDTLLTHGTHIILGQIMLKNKTLHHCKIQVHVIIQSCAMPKYLISQCDSNNVCNFTCRDETQELQGESTLLCGDDMKWEGYLPICRTRNWCKPISPPDYGSINCRGTTTGLTAGFTEGSRCRIRCPIYMGLRWHSKSVTVCRRGNWTNKLKCIPK